MRMRTYRRVQMTRCLAGALVDGTGSPVRNCAFSRGLPVRAARGERTVSVCERSEVRASFLVCFAWGADRDGLTDDPLRNSATLHSRTCRTQEDRANGAARLAAARDDWDGAAGDHEVEPRPISRAVAYTRAVGLGDWRFAAGSLSHCSGTRRVVTCKWHGQLTHAVARALQFGLPAARRYLRHHERNAKQKNA